MAFRHVWSMRLTNQNLDKTVDGAVFHALIHMTTTKKGFEVAKKSNKTAATTRKSKGNH